MPDPVTPATAELLKSGLLGTLLVLALAAVVYLFRRIDTLRDEQIRGAREDSNRIMEFALKLTEAFKDSQSAYASVATAFNQVEDAQTASSAKMDAVVSSVGGLSSQTGQVLDGVKDLKVRVERIEMKQARGGGKKEEDA
jgi:methyl-accepting chemotaxis protein